MAEFINTVDVLGDKALTNSIIDGSITEIADNFVKDIGDFALRGCAALISANFVEATSIGGMAFYGCTKLTTADFPAATSIGNSAFYDCSALNKVNFPVATSIGNGTFNGCYNLATADFPAVKTIDNTAFMYCSRLTALILRSGTLATLGSVNVLEGTPIEKGKGYIYVPSALLDSYKTAANWSTYANQFRVLEDYTVDGTVTGEVDPNRHMVRFFNDDGTLLGYKVVAHGGTATYDGDTPVSSVDTTRNFLGFTPAPTNVTADMDCYAAYGIGGVCGDNVIWMIDEGVLTLSGSGGTYEFSGESPPWRDHRADITKFVVEDGITSLGNNMCSDFSALTEYSFAESVTTIASNCFKNCTSLTTATIPAHLTTIGSSMFSNCLKLTDVVFEEGCVSIPEGCFYNCKGLVNVVIPDSIQYIAPKAFQYCSAFAGNVVIPKQQSKIGESTFSGTAITFMDCGSQVNEFGTWVFYSCKSLTTLIIRSTSVVTYKDYLLYSSAIAQKTGYVYVPSALVSSYKSATGWKDFSSQIRAIEDYPDICG